MISDAGTYPTGMVPGVSFIDYRSEEEVGGIIRNVLEHWPDGHEIVRNARAVMRNRYSKEEQMRVFESIVSRLS